MPHGGDADGAESGYVTFLGESCQFAVRKLNLCAWRRGRVNEEGARRRASGYHSPTAVTTFTGIANFLNIRISERVPATLFDTCWQVNSIGTLIPDSDGVLAWCEKQRHIPALNSKYKKAGSEGFQRCCNFKTVVAISERKTMALR